MKPRLNLTIVFRLRIVYGMLLLPLAFLFFVIFTGAARQVGVARLEIAGVAYTSALFAAYDSLTRENARPAGALAAMLEGTEKRLGAGIGTGDDLAAALRETPACPVPEIAGKIMALIGKVADGSGLTLDTDLDSFYVMDAATGKIPGAIDTILELSGLARGFGATADLTPDTRAKFLLTEGRGSGLRRRHDGIAGHRVQGQTVRASRLWRCACPSKRP